MTPPPAAPFAAVLFDMDGLLLDSERLHRRSLQRAGREVGFPISDTLYGRLIGRGWGDTLRVLREEFGPGIPLERLQALAGRFQDELVDAEGVPLKPGVEACLAWCADLRLPTAVATSSTRGLALRQLARADLLHRFRAVVAGDQVARGKPAPDLYLEAARVLGADPRACLALEDSIPGAASASAAGCTVVVVPDLVEPDDATRGRCAAVLESLALVPAWAATRADSL